MLSVGYYNITLNLIGGPQSNLFTILPDLVRQLHDSSPNARNIIVNGYAAHEKMSVFVRDYKNMRRDQVSEEPGEYFLHSAYWDAVRKGEFVRSHCLSMTDMPFSYAVECLDKGALGDGRSSIGQFFQFACEGAADSRKILVYTLNQNRMVKYDSTHKDFLANLAKKIIY